MILTISAIQGEAQLHALDELIQGLEWRDGRETAGKVAQTVKRNEQAMMNGSAGQTVRQFILPYITDNAAVRSAARPRRFSHVMVSKTAEGGCYGPHVDNALMGQGEGRMRSDLSFTLFITPPDEYDGGELIVHSAGGSQSIKPPAGHLVLYPSSSIHEVKPVTRGERIVCVGWLESLIADARQRELLFDLERTRTSLRAKLPADSQDLLLLDKSIANLLRMWACT
ncbi:Fe2+-dependent dioxygenase [Erythrobacter crassostreae]|uniref:Fe2+-dependent dioxygenase n=1 Tax=Erythrobacter crassostreae TaxID=2828328 RepID=A0A9X1JM73_9SPHN|nr:Fe2+-dependent dioxygenase [Erythrobacter crassostrea]MBV7259104.1 Fe2+-dependent dioxygenase [Erythrobacter crassostrea]